VIDGDDDLGAAARHPRALLLPGIIVLVTVGTLVLGTLVPRDLSQGEDAPIWNVSRDLLAFDLSRAITAVILLASMATITLATIRKGFPRAGLCLWLSYLAFVLSNFVLPGVAGKVPGFDYRLLLPPIAFTAVYFARPMADAPLVTLCKSVLLAFVYSSLLAAVLMPAQALAAYVEGIVPGLAVRLYGVGGGATSLGALSSAYVAIELVSPSPSRWRFLHLIAAATALLLTQAKTSWLFVLLVALALAAHRLWRRPPSLGLGKGPSASATRALFVTCGVAGLLGLAAAQAASLDLGSLRGGENVMSLTGRTYIWATSVRAWLDDPVFGYGLGLWESERFRAMHGPFDHAHNQFLHALASAGLLGLLGLLGYLGTALAAARRAARTSAVPMVLLAGMVSLCITNVPLRAHYVLDAFTLIHLLLFSSLICAERSPESASPDSEPAAERVPPELEVRPGEMEGPKWPEVP